VDLELAAGLAAARLDLCSAVKLAEQLVL